MSNVIWTGQKNDLAAVASSGKLIGGSYEINDRFVVITDGLLSSKTRQIPLYCVLNVEVRQTIVQKARGVGDIVLTLDDELAGQTAILESVNDPKSVIPLINPVIKAARDRRSFGQGEVGAGAVQPGVVLAAGGVPVAGQQDLISQLARLGQLRDTNLLTEEEFEQAKKRILEGGSL